jgi:hypothetical protein
MQRDSVTRNQITTAREVAGVATMPMPGSWLPAAHRVAVLDTRLWATRAARGQSWQGHGIARSSRLAH